MNADGSNQQRLTNTGDGTWPVWSPDGQKIAFTSWLNGDGEVYIISTDGKDLKNLTNHPAEDYIWGSQSWFGEKSGKAIEPSGKLMTTWSKIKTGH
jgi:Tol biopolymer transport system component